jgi:hypothetical protein
MLSTPNTLPFTSPAILTVGAPTPDGGMRIRLETNELSDDEKIVLLKYNNTFGHFLFKPNTFQDSDIPKDNADMKCKSPSQRLRSVLYLLFMESGGKPEDFSAHYNQEIEKIITHYKSKIGN